MKIGVREINRMIKNDEALDMSPEYKGDACAFVAWMRERGMEKLAVSFGMYGMNGALFVDKDGQKWAIGSRNQALFIAV